MDTLLLQCINPSRFHLQLFQTLDEKRIDHTRDNLWKCTNLESRICVEQDEVGFLLPSSLSKRTKRFSSSLVDIRDLLFNYTEASMSQYNFFGKKKIKSNLEQYIYFCIIKFLILKFFFIFLLQLSSFS